MYVRAAVLVAISRPPRASCAIACSTRAIAAGAGSLRAAARGVARLLAVGVQTAVGCSRTSPWPRRRPFQRSTSQFMRDRKLPWAVRACSHRDWASPYSTISRCWARDAGGQAVLMSLRGRCWSDERFAGVETHTPLRSAVARRHAPVPPSCPLRTPSPPARRRLRLHATFV